MFTSLYYDEANDSASYATYGKTDGVATPLETLFDYSDEEVLDIEVANEIGTEIGYSDGPYVLDWNHTTGAIGTYLDAYIANYESEWEFLGLDTLNDGTTVTLDATNARLARLYAVLAQHIGHDGTVANDRLQRRMAKHRPGPPLGPS